MPEVIVCPSCGATTAPGPSHCTACGTALRGAQRATVRAAGVNAVTITDIDMPIGSMVNLILKFAIASIPAMIVIGIVGGVLAAFLTAFLSSATR